MQTKECCRCKRVFPIEQYPVQTKNKLTGRRSECRECCNSYARKYYKNNKKHTERVLKQKEKRRLEIAELKLQKGCEICGYNKYAGALHYHHKNPLDKEYSISWAANHGLSLENIQEEIDKCVVLCSNCHAEVEGGIAHI